MIKNVLTLIVLASLLYACGPTAPVEPTISVNAIHTFAAETVIAEFTQTARAGPPTAAVTATEVAPVTLAETYTSAIRSGIPKLPAGLTAVSALFDLPSC